MNSLSKMEVLAKPLRRALVRKLRRDGTLHSRRVERALRRVPRHLFVPDVDLDTVYRDVHIPTKLLGGELVSSSSQPAIMAIMLEQLAAQPGNHVLEVGAGTGYNAALLAEIVGTSGQVTTIDLDEDTAARARAALNAAGYTHVCVERGDGAAGFAARAPYDRIIATVGLGDIPYALWAQLKPGGRLVMPLSLRGVMKSVAFKKTARSQLLSQSVKPAGFMPFRGSTPLQLREVRIGPELGLYAWFPPDRGTPNTRALYTLLRKAASDDVSTDIQLGRLELESGLGLWLRAHEPAIFTLHADGAYVDSGPVPPFVRSLWAHPAARDRVSIGLWDGDEIALMARDGANANTGPFEPFQLRIKVWGGAQLAQRLIERIQAWRQAGCPTDDEVRLRLIPTGGRSRAAARIPMSAGTLELTWRKRKS